MGWRGGFLRGMGGRGYEGFFFCCEGCVFGDLICLGVCWVGSGWVRFDG